VLNVFTTFAHHPQLLKRWLVFGHHVLALSTFPLRERELSILRIGWLCTAPDGSRPLFDLTIQRKSPAVTAPRPVGTAG
jgi:hypothetical protein